MSRKAIIGGVVLGGIALAVIVATNTRFYGAMAYMGQVPHSPFGWVEVPKEDAPLTYTLHDQSIEELATQANNHITEFRAEHQFPSISATIAIGDELVWEAAIGWADLKEGTPATPNTQYRVGSVSKAITHAGVARLVSRGEFDMETPLKEYLSPLPNEVWSEITPRQLSSHTAGMPHYGNNSDKDGWEDSGNMDKYYATPQDSLVGIDEAELLFEPGTSFDYSSLGTVLLSAVMTEAVQRPYLDIIQDDVMKPVGMTKTLPDPGFNLDRENAHKDFAHFYYLNKKKRALEWRPVDLSHRLAGGGWVSTTPDPARLGVKLLDDSFISAETRELFWTEQKISNGDMNPQGYALGFRISRFESEEYGPMYTAHHAGVGKGGQAWLIICPSVDMVMAIATNARSNDFSEFGGVQEGIFNTFVHEAWKRSQQTPETP